MFGQESLDEMQQDLAQLGVTSSLNQVNSLRDEIKQLREEQTRNKEIIQNDLVSIRELLQTLLTLHAKGGSNGGKSNLFFTSTTHTYWCESTSIPQSNQRKPVATFYPYLRKIYLTLHSYSTIGSLPSSSFLNWGRPSKLFIVTRKTSSLASILSGGSPTLHSSLPQEVCHYRERLPSRSSFTKGFPPSFLPEGVFPHTPFFTTMPR